MLTKPILKISMTDKIEIGVDEAGRGPLFGRVYTAGVVLPDNFDCSRLKDSKKFTSKKKIREVADYIKENAIYSITYSDENQIDKTNILQATMNSMHRSINEIINTNHLDMRDIHLLIDGNYFKPIYYDESDLLMPISYSCIEKGDNTYASIAAASILAKVSRDNYIEELCNANPELAERYSIHTNMGYGAKKHMEGLRLYGPTIGHRMTFEPIKSMK